MFQGGHFVRFRFIFVHFTTKQSFTLKKCIMSGQVGTHYSMVSEWLEMLQRHCNVLFVYVRVAASMPLIQSSALVAAIFSSKNICYLFMK